MGIFDEETAVTEQPAPVENIKPEKIFTSGVCVKVHVGYPGLQKKLQAKDLKVDPKDVPDIFSLGSKRLVPKKSIEAFQQFEREARGIVDTHSYEFYIPGIKFVPKKTLKGVLEKLEEVKKKFLTAADQFIEDYPSLREKMLEEYKEYLDALKPYYPPAHKIKKRFKFDINIFEVHLAKNLSIEGVDIEEAKMESEALQKMQKQMELEAQTKIAEFVTSTIEQSRAAIAEAFQSLREKVGEGNVHGRTIKKINTMIDTLKSLNIAGDDIYDKLATFKKEFLSKETMSDKKFQKEITKQIDGIIQHAQNTEGMEELAEKAKRSLLT